MHALPRKKMHAHAHMHTCSPARPSTRDAAVIARVSPIHIIDGTDGSSVSDA
jgi:hypothetical protein